MIPPDNPQRPRLAIPAAASLTGRSPTNRALPPLVRPSSRSCRIPRFLIAGSISDTSEFVCLAKLRIGQTPDSVPPRDIPCAHGPRQLRQPRPPRWHSRPCSNCAASPQQGLSFRPMAAASSTTVNHLLMCHRSGWCPSWMPSAPQRSRRWSEPRSPNTLLSLWGSSIKCDRVRVEAAGA